MKRFQGFLVFCFIAFMSAARADSSSAAKLDRIGPTSRSSGWRLFGGAGFGYGSVSGKEFSRASGGEHYLLNASLSYQARFWVAETGLGWQYHRLSGADTEARALTIRTRSGLADLSWRYRVTDRLQLGPLLSMAFGADTSQSPSVGSSRPTLHGGALIAYELPVGGFPLRVWQRLTTDLSVGQRNQFDAMIGIQAGIPLRLPFTESDELRVTSSASVRKEDVRVLLDANRVFFRTDSAEVRPEIRALLREVGEYLSQAPKGWSEVVLAGHADRRGTLEHNQELSRARAESVLAAIEPSRKAQARIRVEGHGFAEPLDPSSTREAYARNRRVEIVFKDVRDPETLLRKLEPLR